MAMSPLFTTGAHLAVHASVNNKPWQYVRRGCTIQEPVNAKEDGKITSSTGDWLQEGTAEYKAAKEIFDTLTKVYGTSGAFASGVIANAKGESGLTADLGEGYWAGGGGRNHFGMNSKTPTSGMGPSTSTQEANYGRNYFGGGLFQFTPYTKFTDSKYWGSINKSEGWAPANQLNAMLGYEFWNRMLENYFGRAYSFDTYGGDKFTKVEQLLETDNPEKAALYFMMSYERPESPHPERMEWAKQANAVFNKDNVKATPSKFKFEIKDDVTVDVSSHTERKSDECKSSTTTGNPADWGNDGKGVYPDDAPTMFNGDNIPDSVKEFVLDPRKVGLGFRDATGWTNPGDQCANFASSFLYAIWEKDGQRNPKAAGPGGINEGGLFAPLYAEKYGAKTTKTPSKGAMGSSMSQSAGFDPRWGHVWIVSHVFENGDILVVEQNVARGNIGSGAATGTTNSWHYRYITVATQKLMDATYVSPSDAGYKPSDKIAK